MGRKRQVCVNQQEQAEKILREGFGCNLFPTKHEMKVVSRYWRKFNGWGDAKIKTNLIKLCEKWYPKDAGYKFPYPRFFREIAEASRDKKDLFITKDIVEITKQEVEVLSGIEDQTLRKIAFGFLCLSKRTDYDPYLNDLYATIDIMGLKILRKDFIKHWVFLDDNADERSFRLRLIHYYSVEKGFGMNKDYFFKIKVHFRQKEYSASDVVVKVNLKNKKCGLTAYRKIFGDDLVQCGCGRMFTKSKQATKKTCCDECAAENKRKKTAERQAKFKAKKKGLLASIFG